MCVCVCVCVYFLYIFLYSTKIAHKFILVLQFRSGWTVIIQFWGKLLKWQCLQLPLLALRLRRKWVSERGCVMAGSLERVTSTIKHAPRAGHVLCIDPCNCGRKTPHGNSLLPTNPFFLDWESGCCGMACSKSSKIWLSYINRAHSLKWQRNLLTKCT